MKLETFTKPFAVTPSLTYTILIRSKLLTTLGKKARSGKYEASGVKVETKSSKSTTDKSTRKRDRSPDSAQKKLKKMAKQLKKERDKNNRSRQSDGMNNMDELYDTHATAHGPLKVCVYVHFCFMNNSLFII